MNNKRIKQIFSILLAICFASILFALIDLVQLYSFYRKLVSFENLYYEPTPFNKFSLVRILFAFYSLLLGIHYGLQFYFSEKSNLPKSTLGRILHDSRFFPWLVLFTVGHVCVYVAIFPMFLHRNIHTDTISESLQLVAVLLMIFGFFNSTHHLRRSGIISLKQSLGLFAIIFGLSLGLTNFTWFDRDNLEKSTLSKNVYYNKTITLPTSHYKRKIMRKSLTNNYCIAKNDSTDTIDIYYHGEILKKEDIASSVYEFRDSHREEEFKFLTSVLHIDKDIKLTNIVPYLFEFYKVQHYRIVYRTGSKDEIFPSRLNSRDFLFHDYELNNISYLDSIRFSNTPPPPPTPMVSPYYTPGCLDNIDRIKIKFTEEGIKYQDSLISEKELKELLEKPSPFNKWKHPMALVDYNQTLDAYIRNKSLILKIYLSIRNDGAIIKYGKDFSQLTKENAKNIRRQIPLFLNEFGLNNLSKIRIEDFIKEQKQLVHDNFPF